MPFIKTRTFRISAIVALLLALYALAGFWLAPRLVRSAILEDIPKSLDARPAVGDIRINPFLFRLEVRDFSLAAPNGEKVLGFGRLFVDFELSSIWHRGYSFANIAIDAPAVNVVVAPDGSLNLARLAGKPGAAKPPPGEGTQPQPLPALRVRSFRVSQGSAAYDDRSRPTAFGARIEPISFELRDFTTGTEGGRFTLTGASKLGERVEWHGHLSVQPIESDGEFRIDGLHARTLWEYLADRLGFDVASGDLNLLATYRMSLREVLDLHADISKAAITDLRIKPKGGDADWVMLPSLEVSGTSVDLAGRQARTDSVGITGLKLMTWLEPDGSINLMKLAQVSARPQAPAPTITATPAASAAVAGAQTPWKFELRELALRDASIAAEDRSTRPAAKVLLAPLSLTIGGASLDLARPVSVALDTRIDERGSLTASGEVTPQPLSASFALKLAGISLPLAQPYIAQHTSMTLLSGTLSGDAKVRYGGDKPALRMSGNLNVAGLRTMDNALHDDFVNWERLDIKGIDFQHGPDRLDIDRIEASKLYARVIIEPDTSLNVSRVLASPGAIVVAPAPEGGRPIVATAAPAPQAPATSPRRPAASSSVGMPMSIKQVVLHQAQANFADLSIQPNFATGIRKIDGSVLGLSTREGSRAMIDIKGQVDEFSPVTISGQVNVLSAALYSDIALSFKNMELSVFNPYSGKFAGYNITKGKLTTDLHYRVEARKLDAQHHINIDQLEFGDKTDSKDAVSLPVKLAVALLKDRNGVIDLNVPVTGTLDDPKFKLGPIIWKVVLNILEKAVTAPFALLGSLFGGGPDLQYVDFRPGSAELDPAAQDKARALVKALGERPQLKIDVPIAAVADLDKPALASARFSAQVREAQDGGARRKGGAEGRDFEQLDADSKVAVLTPLYAGTLGGGPKYPDEITGIKSKPDLAAAKAEFLARGLREHIVISDADLAALAQRRASAVQQVLLANSQIAPERVFLVVNDKVKNQDGQVRLEMSLK